MSVLPDTSVWVDYLRHGTEGRSSALDGLLARAEVVACGPVVAELLAGARPPQRSELWMLLSGLPWADLGRSQWQRVGESAAALRAQGQTVPLTDLAIAVAATDAGARVWSTDSDFDRIAAVLDGFAVYLP